MIHAIQKSAKTYLRSPSLALICGSLGCIVLLLSLCLQGPVIHADTATYLHFSPSRSPIYPFILKFNQMLFGVENYQWLILGQLLLGFFASIYVSLEFKKIFGLKVWTTFLLILLFLSPYYGPSKFGNAILTEALCYPFFLLAAVNLLKGLLNKTLADFYYFLGLTTILILTRRQFLFLYPVFAIALIYLWFTARKTLGVGFLSCLFLFSILATNVIERGYQWIYHQHFSTVPFTGIQLIVAPLYLAEPNDAEIFSQEPEKKIFEAVITNMQHRKIGYHFVKYPGSFYGYLDYYENYNIICWGILSKTLSELGIQDPYEIDNITMHMAMTLAKQHIPTYVDLYLRNIFFNLGGFYFSFFLSALFIIAFIMHYRYRDKLSLFALFVLLMEAGNYSLVALVEPVMQRYAAYTDTLLIAMLIILVSRAMTREKI